MYKGAPYNLPICLCQRGCHGYPSPIRTIRIRLSSYPLRKWRDSHATRQGEERRYCWATCLSDHGRDRWVSEPVLKFLLMLLVLNVSGLLFNKEFITYILHYGILPLIIFLNDYCLRNLEIGRLISPYWELTAFKTTCKHRLREATFRLLSLSREVRGWGNRYIFPYTCLSSLGICEGLYSSGRSYGWESLLNYFFIISSFVQFRNDFHLLWEPRLFLSHSVCHLCWTLALPFTGVLLFICLEDTLYDY